MLLKVLQSIKLMQLLRFFFEAVPTSGHLEGAYAKGYNVLKAVYEFVAHFHDEHPLTSAEFREVVAVAEAAQQADAPAPVPAQAPPLGPVSEDELAPRGAIVLP